MAGGSCQRQAKTALGYRKQAALAARAAGAGLPLCTSATQPSTKSSSSSGCPKRSITPACGPSQGQDSGAGFRGRLHQEHLGRLLPAMWRIVAMRRCCIHQHYAANQEIQPMLACLASHLHNCRHPAAQAVDEAQYPLRSGHLQGAGAGRQMWARGGVNRNLFCSRSARTLPSSSRG